MRKVAELAGVSVATVYRVVADHPSVTPETSRAVRDAMAQLNFTPAPRITPSIRNESTLTIGILGFVAGRETAPAYEQLLQGISEAADQARANLLFGYAPDIAQLPSWITSGRVDGLLLGGARPSPELQKRLESIPAVWLMGNRHRPLWGDQVMPDNTAIAQTAVTYLQQRGHTHLACMGVANSGWSLDVRMLAFEEIARDRGLTVDTFLAVESASHDGWAHDILEASANTFADGFLKADPRPTGLFISEDRLLAPIDRVLAARGIPAGPNSGIDVISCNNEREYRTGLRIHPASIDINVNSIGRRAVELLVSRIRHPRLIEGRSRLMVSPTLIPAIPTT